MNVSTKTLISSLFLVNDFDSKNEATSVVISIDWAWKDIDDTITFWTDIECITETDWTTCLTSVSRSFGVATGNDDWVGVGNGVDVGSIPSNWYDIVGTGVCLGISPQWEELGVNDVESGVPYPVEIVGVDHGTVWSGHFFPLVRLG